MSGEPGESTPGQASELELRAGCDGGDLAACSGLGRALASGAWVKDGTVVWRGHVALLSDALIGMVSGSTP